MIVSLARRLATAGIAGLVLAAAAPAYAASDYDDGGAPPWRGSTKDGYPIPQPPPPDYRQGSYKDDPLPPPAPPRRIVSECLSKYGIRSALNRQGWHDFDDVEIRGDIAYLNARNDGGRRFDLRIDSCTGEVIDAHPRVVYVEPPPPRVYYDGYYAPRPAIGFGVYGGYGWRHRW